MMWRYAMQKKQKSAKQIKKKLSRMKWRYAMGEKKVSFPKFSNRSASVRRNLRL